MDKKKIGLLSLAAVLESMREGHSFKTTEYRIRSKRLSALDGELRIVLLSDLHDHRYGPENRRLYRTIVDMKPDLILLAGDMITSMPGKSHDSAKDLIIRLARRYPVFYGIGNHEARMMKNPSHYRFDCAGWLSELQDKGVRVLHDRTEKIRMHGQSLSISGLTVPPVYYKRTLHPVHLDEKKVKERIGAPDKTAYRIVIAHTPTEEAACAKWGADLTVSGHLHGGVVCLFGHIGLITPQFRIFCRRARGCFRSKGSRLVVSAGLGTHLVPFRFMDPPEVVLLRLKKAGKGH